MHSKEADIMENCADPDQEQSNLGLYTVHQDLSVHILSIFMVGLGILNQVSPVFRTPNCPE